MNKKKKLIILLLILLTLILFCKSLFNFSTTSYKLKYNNNEFRIKEIYGDTTYIEINSKNKTYPIKLHNKINNKKIIDKIYYYKDKTYECILPITNNKLITDMMCYNDKTIYNYNSILGNDSELDNYVKKIDLYNIEQFKDDIDSFKNINTVKLFTNNRINNITAITTYKGLIISDKEIELFKKDVYNNKLSTFVDHYYLIADYENDYEFTYFYIVDLLDSKTYKIKYKEKISLDSYIQGIVDNKVYLYDKDNEVQYKIDVENKKIELIGKENSIKYYKNKKWETINKNKANKELYFDYSTLDNDFTDYSYVIKTNNYYYLFDKNGSNYDLYRVDINNLDIRKFILKIPTTQIYYKDDYIYYQYKNRLYYYSDNTGLKTILENSEFQFNNTIKYYIY